MSAMSVYLSVAPPDGFTRWGDSDWDRWLREHPWESAERICSRGDWAIFLYQVRQHSDRGKKLLEPLLDQLVNEKPLSTQEARDLGAALAAVRADLTQKPASDLADAARSSPFASSEDVETMIAEVWSGVFDQVAKVLENAVKERRGVYFGNV